MYQGHYGVRDAVVVDDGDDDGGGHLSPCLRNIKQLRQQVGIYQRKRQETKKLVATQYE